MAKKRKHAEHAARPSTDTTKAQVDPTCGQKSFFPGLDGSSDDDISAEAFAYLRSVRTEANGIPILLTAPRDDSYEGATAFIHTGGYYSDGAYVANASESVLNLDEETIEHHAVQLIEPQLAWHKSLTSRFKSYRSHLKPAVSESVLSAFDTVSNPIATDFGHPSSAGALQWKLILRTTIPKPTQLALMDQDTVRWLLELIPYVARRARWLKEDGKQGRCISAWIWGLLARLDELDTLSSEEVSVVRDLGKHAGGIIFGLDDQGSDEEQPVASNIQDKTPKAKPTGTARSSKLRRNSSSDEEEDVGEVEAVEEDEKSLVTPEPRHQVGEGHATNDIDDMPFTACTKEEALSGTLDMMLTIIGECYGQRDLLVARDKLWTIQGTQY